MSVSNSKITSRHKDFTIGDYYSRIKKYNQLLSLFNKIDNNQCLKSFHKHGDNYFYEIDNGLITLKRRIGSNSRYGVIFLSSNKINKTMFATKLMIKDKHNHNEIIIAEKLSNITLNDNNPHFLLVFKHLECNKSSSRDNNLPTIIKFDNYYICVNELVSGNLKQFINEHSKTPNFILNAFQQILIAILSFHYYTNGYFHNDCHYKNFLYHKITPGGYFHYQIFGKNVYIKNTDVWGFVMVYSSILEEMFNRFDKLNGKELLIYDKLKYLIIHFLFEDPLKVIDIDELVKEGSTYRIQGTSSKLTNLKKLGISNIKDENYTYYYQMDYSDSLCFDDLNIIDYQNNIINT